MNFEYSELWLKVHANCKTEADYIVLSTFGATMSGLVGIEHTINTDAAELLARQSNVPYNKLFVSARHNEVKHAHTQVREQLLLETYTQADITYATKRMEDATIIGFTVGGK